METYFQNMGLNAIDAAATGGESRELRTVTVIKEFAPAGEHTC